MAGTARMVEPQISIIIPIADYHAEQSTVAITAAIGQTVPVTVITAHDETGRGAGAARNAALSRVTTPFTVFLDADDWIDHNFCAECLAVIRPGTYIYTDWKEDGKIKQAPDKCWCDENWHCITSLIPTEAIRQVGGFDESLPAAEDTALYWALARAGYCGTRLPKPLFHYGAGGQRAKRFVRSPIYQETMRYISERYGGKVACCGDNELMQDVIPEGLPGDVLVQAVWSGNRMQRGTVSGRLYERTGNGKKTRVDPRDQQARPDLWRLVEQTPALKPQPVIIERAEPAAVRPQSHYIPHGVAALAEQLWGVNVPLPLEQLVAITPAVVKPDVGALARLTGVSA